MKRFLATLAAVSFLLSSCGTDEPAPETEQGSEASSKAVVKPDTSFRLEGGNPEGTVHVVAFAEQEVVVEPFCFDDSCQEYDYVFLNIQKSDDLDFDKFLSEYGGNAFASDKRVGIGCIEDDRIVYENDSDDYGRKEFVLSKDLSKKILASTKEQPITLTLTKLLLTGGSGAPACYSHFSAIEETK